MNKFFKNNLLIIFILAFVTDSCSYPEMVRNELVYENDFEDSDLSSIDGGEIMFFNNTNVIGDFNNDGFTLFLENVEIMIMFLFHLIYIFMDLGMVI